MVLRISFLQDYYSCSYSTRIFLHYIVPLKDNVIINLQYTEYGVRAPVTLQLKDGIDCRLN